MKKIFLPTVLLSLCLSFSALADDGTSHEGGRTCQPGTPACPAGLVVNPPPADDDDGSGAVTQTLLEYFVQFFK